MPAPELEEGQDIRHDDFSTMSMRFIHRTEWEIVETWDVAWMLSPSKLMDRPIAQIRVAECEARYRAAPATRSHAIVSHRLHRSPGRSLTNRRAADLARSGTPGAEGSLGKIMWTEHLRRMTDVISDVLGPRLIAEAQHPRRTYPRPPQGAPGPWIDVPR